MSRYFVTSRKIPPLQALAIGFSGEAYRDLKELIKRRAEYFEENSGNSRSNLTAKNLEITANGLHKKLKRDQDGIVYFSLDDIATTAKQTKNKARSLISRLVTALRVEKYNAGKPYEEFYVYYWKEHGRTYGYFRPIRENQL